MLTCDPLKYIMDNPILIVFSVGENPSEYKVLKMYNGMKFTNYEAFHGFR